MFRRFALPLALSLIATTALAQVPMDPLDARDAVAAGIGATESLRNLALIGIGHGDDVTPQ